MKPRELLDRKHSNYYAVHLFECGIQYGGSTSIDSQMSYGYGKLDDYGFFEFPLYFKETN